MELGPYTNILGWLTACIAVLWFLHRLALWLERRGWLFYVNSRNRGSRGSFAVGVASALDPTIRHVIETQHVLAEQREQDEAGEPLGDSPESDTNQ